LSDNKELKVNSIIEGIESVRKHEDLYIGGRGVVCRENMPEAQQIWDTPIFYARI